MRRDPFTKSRPLAVMAVLTWLLALVQLYLALSRGGVANWGVTVTFVALTVLFTLQARDARRRPARRTPE